MTIALAVTVALSCAIVGTLVAIVYKLAQLQPPEIVQAVTPKAFDDSALWSEFAKIDVRMSDLTLAVAEGIDHVQRNESRVRGIVTGAKRRFAAEGYEDAGVEAEYQTLPEPHVSDGDGQQLPLLPEDVEDVVDPAWHVVPGE